MAANAIKTMDGRNVEGSSLSVRLANRDKDKGINNKPSSNLYVANLPQKVTELDLRMIFSRYGDIHSLRVLKYPNTGVLLSWVLVGCATHIRCRIPKRLNSRMALTSEPRRPLRFPQQALAKELH